MLTRPNMHGAVTQTFRQPHQHTSLGYQDSNLD